MKQKECRKVDWNSLFSTISQASASMIGVILAFLVARIISEISDYDRLEYDSQALIDESVDLKARIRSMNFEWHDARIFEEHDLREAQADLAELHSANDEKRLVISRKYYQDFTVLKSILANWMKRSQLLACLLEGLVVSLQSYKETCL